MKSNLYNRKNNRGRGAGLTILTAALCVFSTLTALPATKTWSPLLRSSNWSTAGNWSPSGVPANGDDLVFNEGTSTNDLPNLRPKSLTFNGAYTLQGNPITLTGGITASHSTGYVLIYNTITNTSSQTFYCSRATMLVLGDVHLGSTTLTVNTPGTLDFRGVISGTGGFTKNGIGLTKIYGAAGNTYTGTTRVNAGTLELGKNAGKAMGGPLVVGGAGSSATVRLLANYMITGSAVTVNSQGVLDLNGYAEQLGVLALVNGRIQTGTGTLNLGGDLFASGNSTITGKMNVVSNKPVINVTSTVFGEPGLVISATITGTYRFVKEGPGLLTLSGNNSYEGVIVSNGVVAVAHSNALGNSTGAGLYGGSLQIEAGVNVKTTLGIHSTNSFLEFAGNAGASAWEGPIVLHTNLNIYLNGDYPFTLSGVISGEGGITKYGPGPLDIFGDYGNTYSGTTTINDGLIQVFKTAGLAIPGPLVLGDGVGEPWLILGRDDLLGTMPVAVTNGQLDLGGFNNTIGSLTLSGAAVTTEVLFIDGTKKTGVLTLAGDLNAIHANGIYGELNLGGAVRSFNMSSVLDSLDIHAVISGGNGINKNGDGTLRLYGANTYTGLTTLNRGRTELFHASALGAAGSSANGTIAVRNNVCVQGVNIGNEFLTLSNYSRMIASGTAGWMGPIALHDAVNFDVDGTFDLSGAISGPGRIEKWKSGTMYFSGSSANTYTNSTQVYVGTLVLRKTVQEGAIHGFLGIGLGSAVPNNVVVRLQGVDQLANNTGVNVGSDGLLDVNGVTCGFGALEGSGNITLGTGGIYPGIDNSSSIFGGIISGVGLVDKRGTGTLSFTGNNTYTGPTYVRSGTLSINGSQRQSDVYLPDVSIGTLGGTGTVGKIYGTAGQIAPGNSPGILTSSDLSLNFGNTFVAELNGTAPGAGHDQLKVNGTVNLGNARLSATMGFTSSVSNSFTIIENDGAEPVMGTFYGLPEGSALYISGIPFRITYKGGTGNDVVLSQLLPAPTLTSFRGSNGSLMFSWPIDYSGFVLESNTNLNSNAWVPVTTEMSVVGGYYVVSSDPNVPQNFYRLRSP